MSKSAASTQRSRLYPAVLLVLAAGVVGLAAWTASSSPAMASILSISDTAVPTQYLSFAEAEIAKPAYTATPALAPTLPSTLPTEAPEPTATSALIYAEIVPDTPAPEYSVQAASQIPPASIYGGNKYILVDISEQHMYVYEGDLLVHSFIASTGMNGGTRIGTFSVLDKIPNAYGSTWNIWMPNWLGIYYSGGLENGIHALPILSNGAQLWAGYLGTPISYGCVVIGAYESQLLYDWAEVGTPVEIRW